MKHRIKRKLKLVKRDENEVNTTSYNYKRRITMAG